MINFPEKIRIRLVFKFKDELFTRFYWFEMRNDELYWGTPYKSKAFDITSKIEDNKMNITIPQNFDDLPLVEIKNSYHKSGQVHLKKTDKEGKVQYSEPNHWPIKEQIQKPVNIYTVISKVIKHYDKKIVNPDKGKSYSIRFPITDEFKDKRFYMECYLCPEGAFEFPKPLLLTNIPKENIATISLNKNLILVVRFAMFDSLLDWHPDKEISLLPTKI
jgi:hypothetical protein